MVGLFVLVTNIAKTFAPSGTFESPSSIWMKTRNPKGQYNTPMGNSLFLACPSQPFESAGDPVARPTGAVREVLTARVRLIPVYVACCLALVPRISPAQPFGAPAPYFWYSDGGSVSAPIDMVILRTRATLTTPATYFETLGWNQGATGGGYTGIQDSGTAGKNFIFSLWDPTVAQSKTTTAVYAAPGGQVSRFGGEGTGLHYLNYAAGWNLNQWYRFVVRRWDYQGDTYFGLWTFDETASVWTQHVTMDYPSANVSFDCCTNSFVEDWSGGGGANVRRAEFQDGWVRHGAAGWAGLRAGNFVAPAGTTQGNGPYLNALDGGLIQNGWYMQSGRDTVTSMASGSALSLPVSGNAPAVVTGATVITAAHYDSVGHSLTVNWAADPAKAPQFSYSIQVFGSADYSGSPLASAGDVSPHTRSASMTVPAAPGGFYYVQLNVTDIFDAAEAPARSQIATVGAAVPTPGSGIVAYDNFQVPPYAVATLAGQTASGYGFAGTWKLLLGADLAIPATGQVGRPSAAATGAAGDYAAFTSPVSLASGPLYFGYDITNQSSSALNSTRIDLSTSNIPVTNRVLLGAVGTNAAFNLTLESGLGTPVVAQTKIPSTGTHRLVGVLDSASHLVGIFVDPTAQSFWSGTGGNADATAAWTPASGLVLGSIGIVENLSDHVTFSNLVISTDPSVITLRVTAVGTAVALSSSLNPASSGTAVTLTAAMTPLSAAGTVTFLDGTTVIGTGKLNAGFATLSVSALSVGSHSLTASYGGAGSYSSSVSSALQQVVTPPLPTISSVLNSASYQASVAPGTWVAIFGQQLAPSAVSATSAPFPTQLSGVSVTVAGVAAPLQYVSGAQINALVPFEAASLTNQIISVPVVVTTPAGASAPFSLSLRRNAPGLYSANATGTGAADAFDASFNPVTKVGTDPIILYATGLGPTNPPAATGALGAGAEPFNRVVDNVFVSIGGNAAQVLFAGLAPGLHGIYQLNVLPNPYSGNSVSITVGTSSNVLTLPLPLGQNVMNVTGSIKGLYPPDGTTTPLTFSALLNAASFDIALDIAAGAKPFSVVARATGPGSSASAGVFINPLTGTWSANYTVPTLASDSWSFPSAFRVTDFFSGSTFPGGAIPASRLDPAAISAIASLPVPNMTGGSVANGIYQVTGTLPLSNHVSLAELGIPNAFGGFSNIANVKGTYAVTFTLTVDGVLVASKTGSYVIQ